MQNYKTSACITLTTALKASLSLRSSVVPSVCRLFSLSLSLSLWHIIYCRGIITLCDKTNEGKWQVIELKCGGVVVGYTFHHQIADAYSASMFLVNFMGWDDPVQAIICGSIFPALSPQHQTSGLLWSPLDDMYVPISAFFVWRNCSCARKMNFCC